MFDTQPENLLTLTSLAAPDLIIGSITATSGTSESYLNFSYSIKNQGTATAGYNYTAFYLSTDTTLDSSDTSLGFDGVSSLSAGVSRTESASVYLDTGLSAGTYYLFAEADGWDGLSESNENNNLAYQAITITAPDLIIGSITATSGTPESYLNFSYSIKNQGTANAGYNYTAFYLSTDTTLDSSDTYLGFDGVSSLSAGVSRTESASVYLDNSLSAGTYYLFAEADGWDDSSESDENNNLAYQSITITAPAQPDLVVSGITASTGTPGSNLNFSYSIKNQGTATAAHSYTAFYLSTDTTLDSSDTYLGFDDISSLSAGVSRTESSSVYLDNSLSAGTYYLFAEADGWDYLSESNENNNLAYQSITITAPAQPDLVVSGITASTGTRGNNLNFSYSIKNQGTGTAAYSYTAFYLSTDTTLDSSDTFLGFDDVRSLSAGVSRTESTSVYLDTSLNAGTYYLFAKADGWDYLSESNENNNVAYKAITIRQPDLLISSITATSGTPGSNLNFSYSIKNQGSGAAGSNYTGFYLSTDTTLDTNDTYLGYDDVNSLSVGVSRTESTSVYLNTELSAGTYYLFAKADDWNYISESNENNNVAYKAITITAPAQPDLLVSSITASTGIPGSNLNFSYSIKNQGTGTAGYSYTAFYLSTDTTLDSSDRYLDYDYVNSLSAGVSRTESASVYIDASLSAGTYYLFAAADGWDNVGESNENNNAAYKAITIRQPDLVISSITATSGTPGSNLNFSYSIKNQGSGAAGSNYTIFYLSTDNTLDTNDIYLGYDDVSSLSAGASRTESASVYLDISLSAGTYYLFAAADDLDDVGESNENNNIFSTAITIVSAAQDLVVDSITATSGTPGTDFNFSYSINNQGTQTAGESYTAFYLSTNTTLDSTDIYLGYDRVSSLAAGTSSNISTSVYLNGDLITGIYYLFVGADDWDDVAESNENNNIAYTAISISGATEADLEIVNISAISGTPGTNLNFTYDIKNQGSASAVASSTAFYLSKDTTLDSSDTYLGLDTVASLTAGNSQTESVSLALSSSLALGTYYLLGKADNDGAVAENDENNNVAYQEIVIATDSQVDLAISSIPATSGIAGSNLNFTYIIKNQGSISSSNSVTGFYLSQDTTLDASDAFLGSDAVASLSAGVSRTESASVNLASSLTSGTYYLFAKADYTNSIVETNDDNNTTYQTITIQGSDGSTDWFTTNLKDGELINLTRNLSGDGNLSRNDMIAILRDAQDGAVIDANEVTDLRTIVSNATRFTMQDYVRALSDYVVNGNPANQWWTGGQTSRTALGNLYAGSSDTQMEKLIGKWFLGTDRPNPLSEGDSANQNGTNTSNKTYRAVSGSLFQNGISPEDINQGAVGDCYYVATLASIAQEKPSYIQNMFIDNGDNTYTVRFFNNGVAHYVTVDNYLPTNTYGYLVYANPGSYYNNSNNELWVALAEKAYAQLAESGWSRPGDVSNDYRSIEGGWMDYVIKQVTGLDATFRWISNMTKTQLISLVNSSQILTAGFVYGQGYGVYNGHAYTISSYNATTDKFHLRNPWGSQHADVTWQQLLNLQAAIIWSNT